MKPQSSLAVLLFLAVLLVALRPNLAAGSRHLKAADDTDFVRENCNVLSTVADICYKTLAPYAGSFGRDVGKMALKSVEISLSKVRETFNYVSKLKLPPGADQTLVFKVGTVKDLLKNDVEYNEEGLADLRKLVPRPRMPESEFKRQVREAQTQIYFVEVDIGDFLDEFNAPDSRAKADVAGRLNQVVQYAGVSVGLLKRYMDG